MQRSIAMFESIIPIGDKDIDHGQKIGKKGSPEIVLEEEMFEEIKKNKVENSADNTYNNRSANFRENFHRESLSYISNVLWR